MRERGRKIHVCSRGKRQRLETGVLGADRKEGRKSIEQKWQAGVQQERGGTTSRYSIL